MKETFDARGRQMRIFRLASFDVEGLLHTATFRALVLVALVTAVVLLVNLLSGRLLLLSRVLLIAVWLLITPQMFEVTKGISMIATDGLVFGHLNKLWEEAQRTRKIVGLAFYRSLPFVSLILWFVLLTILVVRWFG